MKATLNDGIELEGSVEEIKAFFKKENKTTKRKVGRPNKSSKRMKWIHKRTKKLQKEGLTYKKAYKKAINEWK